MPTWDVHEMLTRRFYGSSEEDQGNKAASSGPANSSDQVNANPELHSNENGMSQSVEVDTPSGSKRIEVVSFTFTNPGFEDVDGAGSVGDKTEIPPKYEQAASREYSETCCETLLSCRWSLSFSLFLACWALSALKVNMSLAILCMIEPRYISTTADFFPDQNMTVQNLAINNLTTHILTTGKMLNGEGNLTTILTLPQAANLTTDQISTPDQNMTVQTLTDKNLTTPILTTEQMLTGDGNATTIQILMPAGNLTTNEVSTTVTPTTLNGSTTTLDNTSILKVWYLKPWTRDTQAWILSAFFYGYISSLILGSFLSGRYGGRIVLITGTFILGLTNLVIPFAARIDDYQMASAYVVLALRVLSGVGAGVMLSSIFNLWARWLPSSERSTHVVFCYSGCMVGNILVMGTGGYFCELSHVAKGWPLIFYIWGGLCIIFGIIFCFTIFDSPLNHPRISEKEKDYIIHSVDRTQGQMLTKLPWRKMLFSKAIWALFLVHLFFACGDSVLVTKLPAYVENSLRYNIGETGYVMCAIFGVMLIFGSVGTKVLDLCAAKNCLSTAIIRKAATAVAMIGSVVILIVSVHLPNLPDRNLLPSTVLLIVALGILHLKQAGFISNFFDVAPRYSGEIFAISSTLAALPALGSPHLVNFLTPNDTLQEWRIIFYIWAGLFLLGTILYTILGQGNEQDWAKRTYDEIRGEKRKSSKQNELKETEEWFDIQFKASQAK